MRCALVLASDEAFEGCSGLTGLESAGFDHFAISRFASRPGRYFISSRRRWSAIVGIAKRFPSLAFWARRQLQTIASGGVTSSGGRYASLLASTAQAMRAILLARATATMLV